MYKYNIYFSKKWLVPLKFSSFEVVVKKKKTTKVVFKFCGEYWIGYCADLWSASLNAFPFHSPWGPLQIDTQQEVATQPVLCLCLSSYKQVCIMIYINKEDVKRHLLASFFAESTGFEPVDTLRYRQFSKLLV